MYHNDVFQFFDFHFQNEGRGLKDPEGVKRKKQRQEQAETKALNDRQGGGGGLKVSMLKLSIPSGHMLLDIAFLVGH